MANRFWVGGSGTWDNASTANWSTTSGGASGASAPTTADAAIFDANSNTGTNDFTVTLGTSPACQTLNTTGIDPTNAMTVDGTGNLSVAGTTFTLTNKVSWTNTGTITFSSTGTVNITTAGVSIASNTSFGVSGVPTYNFVDAFTSTGDMTLSRGTMTTTGSNKTITVSAFLSSAAGGGSRTVNFGASSTCNITGNNKTILNTAAGTVTWTSPATINLTYSGSTGTRTILAQNTLAAVTINVSSGSDAVVFTANDAIKALNFTGFTGTWNNVAMTIAGALTTVSGMTTGSGAGIVTLTTTSTLTTGGITYNFPLTINGTAQTITLSGNLTLDAASTLTLTLGTFACGANSVSVGRYTQTGGTITKTTPSITVTGNAATIVTLTAGTASGFTFSCTYAGGTGTRTFNITTQTPAIAVAAGSDTVTFTASNSIGALDFTGFSGSWTNVAMTLRGLTLSTGMTVSAGANIVTFAGTATYTSNGKTMDFPVTVNGSGITVTLGDALTMGTSRTLTLTQGTINAVSYNVTAGTFSSSNTNTRTLALGSGTWTVSGSGASAWNCSTSTNLTVTGTGKISMTSASAKTFAGGGSTWPILEQGGAGALTISGNNTFTTLQNSTQPATVTFTAGTTQTVTNFNLSGTAGNLVTINSTTPASQATLSKSSGRVSASYLSVQDSNATGGAVWTATASLNTGNNTGWNFGSNGFMALFP